MRPRPPASGRWALALALALGCVTRTERLVPSGPAVAAGTPDVIETMARDALLLDAAGDRAADTLYAPEAQVVANARLRFAAPRFAGLGAGGRVTVAGATVTLEGHFAWVLVDYGWVNAAGTQAERGRATFVCEQKPRGWKIVHVHSSQLLPWDR